MTTPRQGGAMSALRLTGAQRRPMQKLAERVDRMTRVDGLFFERWLDRQHRVRLASQAEINQQELFDGKLPPIPPGRRLFTVVRGVSPDALMCLCVPNLEYAGADLSEAVARRIFEWVVSSHTPKIEARLRKAAGARP